MSGGDGSCAIPTAQSYTGNNAHDSSRQHYGNIHGDHVHNETVYNIITPPPDLYQYFAANLHKWRDLLPTASASNASTKEKHSKHDAAVIASLAGISHSSLPRLENCLQLYNDKVLQEDPEQLFVHLVQNPGDSPTFSLGDRLKLTWEAFIQPYQQRFDQLKQKIDASSTTGEAELQSRYSLDTEVRVLQDKFDKALLGFELMMSKICEVQRDTALRPSLSLSQQQTQLTEMISCTSDDRLPLPAESLDQRLGFLRRHASRYNVYFDTVWGSLQINQWSASSASSSIFVHGSMPTKNETLAIGTLMARFVKETGVTVLWAFPSRSEVQKSAWTGILKYLTMQALQHNNERVCKALSHDFNILHVATAASEREWEALLLRALSGVSLAYIIIDLSILEDIANEDVFISVLSSIDRLLSMGSRALHTVLKIALLSDKRATKFEPAATNVLNVDAFARQARYKRKKPSLRGDATGKMQVPQAFRPKSADHF